MIGKIFSGIVRGLDVLRKFLHLVLLLLIFGIVVGALRTSIPHVADRSALVIQPYGDIVEQLTGSPVDQALERAQGNRRPETLLWDLTDALKAAKKDSRISAVVLDLNYMSGGGQPTLAELTAAIRDFRSSGKKVVAYSTAFLQESYYVAAAADEIYVDPLGLVGIRALPHVLQGAVRQARRRDEPVPRRRVQERGGGLRPHRHVAGGS
jgi:protease-4